MIEIIGYNWMRFTTALCSGCLRALSLEKRPFCASVPHRVTLMFAFLKCNLEDSVHRLQVYWRILLQTSFQQP